MTLTTRVSSFFLAALAVVLVGFSTAIYLAARVYLLRQADDRLGAAVDSLVAIAEVQNYGIEWDPSEHYLAVGAGPGVDQVRWTVRDNRDKLVDRSANLGKEDLHELSNSVPAAERETIQRTTLAGQPWHVQQKWLRPSQPSRQAPAWAERDKLHPALLLTAAVPLAPLSSALSQLATVLVASCLVIWLLAALVGRWLCRRALAPLAAIAAAAHEMDAEDIGHRLPAPQTGDELESLGQAINGLLGRLEDALVRQQRFSGDASHQLRTPLTAMLGQLEVALRRERTTSEYREILNDLQTQAKRLRHVVETLLFLARGEADLVELHPLDLREWLAANIGKWSTHIPTLRVHIPQTNGDSFAIRVQEPLFEQLLDNLFDNAQKYGKPQAPITVDIRREPSTVVLTVEDQGPGIDAEDLPHIFEPFYRSKGARLTGRPGVGLGLALARRIAEAFGATITVASQPGLGARFSVRFPSATVASPSQHLKASCV
jgi:heavy metal sensor kinase